MGDCYSDFTLGAGRDLALHDGLNQVPSIRLVRHSQIVINDLLKEYATIEGNTNINSETSKRWIKWLGAEFIYPPEGDRLAFIIRRK